MLIKEFHNFHISSQHTQSYHNVMKDLNIVCSYIIYYITGKFTELKKPL